MRQAVRLVVLGAFTTVSLALFIIGCAVMNNWYPLFVIIPVVLSVLFVYALLNTLSDSYSEAWINAEGYTFLTTVTILSGVFLPIVLYTVGTIKLLTLILHLVGDFMCAVGITIYLYFDDEDAGSLAPF